MQLVESFFDAARVGDLIMVDRMLRGGMPVDASNGSWTVLHCAATFNRTDVVKHLLHEGADVNRQTSKFKVTPLHYAARYNNTEVARLLLDNGADVNLKNKDNKTPLDDVYIGNEVRSMLLQVQQSAP